MMIEQPKHILLTKQPFFFKKNQKYINSIQTKKKYIFDTVCNVSALFEAIEKSPPIANSAYFCFSIAQNK